MTRSKVVHARRLRLAGLVVGMTAGATASAQQRDVLATWSWVDQYYADYAAMSAAPTGQAMDKWLAHYAPYAFFEDPTAAFFKDSPNGLEGIGRDMIRKAYVSAFTGPLGPVRWAVQRRVTSGEWVAVEGWVEGTQSGKPARARFTTWLKIRRGQIVHQIDYIDYAAIERQVSGKEPVPNAQLSIQATSHERRHSDRAVQVSAEFYRRYDAMPDLASQAGITRFVELLTEDFSFEDPTGRLKFDSREKMHASLTDALTAGDVKAIHWEVDRRITDGEWVALEGSVRGVFKGRPFGTRFTTWLQVRGDKVARQIDYVDYATFRRLTSPAKVP